MKYFRATFTRYMIFLNCIFLTYACASQQPYAHAYSKYFDSLQQRLMQDGFDKKGIQQLYGNSSVHFNVKSVASYFVHKESTLNYDQFTEPGAIAKALDYMEQHKTDLINAEGIYGVNREVITAILLVETGLGNYLGRRMVLNTLSTMAALADSNVRYMLWKQISDTTELSKAEFEAKAEKKSDWAYRELKAFLSYTHQEQLNPLEIYGSYAGAMGICQFMPSNILTLARDGNNDGKIDLFSHSDAIMSVANYLKHYGWRPGIDKESAYDVIYQYNHSSYYVNTILKIAELLKG